MSTILQYHKEQQQQQQQQQQQPPSSTPKLPQPAQVPVSFSLQPPKNSLFLHS